MPLGNRTAQLVVVHRRAGRLVHGLSFTRSQPFRRLVLSSGSNIPLYIYNRTFILRAATRKQKRLGGSHDEA
jgi:hypothetical protein